MQQAHQQQSKWPTWLTWLRIAGFIVALLIVIAGIIIWVFAQGFLATLLGKIITGVGILLTLLQFIPVFFSHKSPDPAPPQHPVPPPPIPPIHIHNYIPPSQPQVTQPSSVSQPSPTPASPVVEPPAPPAGNLSLRTSPPPTGSRHIQPRTVAVNEVYNMLIDPNALAVALCGIGGIGKSTLASLVYKYAEQERRAGREPFRNESIWLRINANTTFSELAANIFAASGKPMPDLSNTPLQNQAFAVFNALNTADPPRLIVLDQFENFLDDQGWPLAASAGVGEFLDVLNSQSCTSRILLTSRPRPHGTHDDDPAALSIYRVGGLNEQEGAAYLRSFDDVKATEADLYEAVRRCQGHALSLKFIHTLLETHKISLSTLLTDPDYQQLWHGRIATNLLDDIFKNLPAQSQQLLCAFSVYREAVPIEAALAIVDSVPKLQALEILDSLLSQHLIQSSNGLYELHPIVADYAHDYLARSVTHASNALQEAHAKAAQYYLQIVSAKRSAGGLTSITGVQPLIEAVWQLCQAGKYQEAYQLMDDEYLFGKLRLWGANTDLLELCQLLLNSNWQWMPQQKALIVSYIASVSNVLGQKQQALNYYEQALRIMREVGDRPGEGTTLNNLGHVYDDLGQKPKALDYYEQALRLRREVGDRPGEGTTLNNLGGVYSDLGQKQKALEYYEQALGIRREVGDRYGESTTLHNIGTIYFDQHRYDVALACFLLARSIFEQVQSPDVDDEVQWIAYLRQQIGEEQFAALLAEVEPRAEQVVEEALREGLGDHDGG